MSSLWSYVQVLGQKMVALKLPLFSWMGLVGKFSFSFLVLYASVNSLCRPALGTTTSRVAGGQ